MGGAFSEPGTLVDLSQTVLDTYESKKKQQQCDLYFEGLHFDQVINALVHVDDFLVVSKLLCSDCIVKSLHKMFPADIWLSLEEKGPLLRF